MSASDLDSRIAGALQREAALPDDIAALLAEVEAALTKTGDELSRARSEAFDPLSTTAAVASARGVTFDAEFRHGRLVVARDRSARSTRRLLTVSSRSVERRRMRISLLAVMSLRRASRACGAIMPRCSRASCMRSPRSTRRSPPRIGCGWAVDRPGESVARPGVWDLDQHKIVGMATRFPPWYHDAHRSGALLWPPQPPKLNLAAMVPAELRQRDDAIAAEANEATEIASRLEEANRLSRGARRRCWRAHGDDRHRRFAGCRAGAHRRGRGRREPQWRFAFRTT